ncbi:hypothetical protein EJ08DRAFT_704656 [Tothia fuscella]|uniref:Uncharacterized protein n=1 Tax=Tothia fuscella TaxID=1048955 RepID=A0A9P4U5J5_9PEZI|nr:hypothetical protein EJ08DRAFT_704656 [Tothia fuscella]
MYRSRYADKKNGFSSLTFFPVEDEESTTNDGKGNAEIKRFVNYRELDNPTTRRPITKKETSILRPLHPTKVTKKPHNTHTEPIYHTTTIVHPPLPTTNSPHMRVPTTPKPTGVFSRVAFVDGEWISLYAKKPSGTFAKEINRLYRRRNAHADPGFLEVEGVRMAWEGRVGRVARKVKVVEREDVVMEDGVEDGEGEMEVGWNGLF